MWQFHFAILTGILGFGIPLILNKMVAKEVQSDLAVKKSPALKHHQFNHHNDIKAFKAFE